jgi:hypothetical protein
VVGPAASSDHRLRHAVFTLLQCLGQRPPTLHRALADRPLPPEGEEHHSPREERGPGGLTREVETPLPSNSPHDHMILRVDLVGSHGRWKRPCLQTTPECDQEVPYRFE